MGIPKIENLRNGNSQDRKSEEWEFPQSIMCKMGFPMIENLSDGNSHDRKSEEWEFPG